MREENFWGSNRGWNLMRTMSNFPGHRSGNRQPVGVLAESFIVKPSTGAPYIMTLCTLVSLCLDQLVTWPFFFFFLFWWWWYWWWDSEAKRHVWNLWATLWSISPTHQKPWIYNLTFFIYFFFHLLLAYCQAPLDRKIFVLKFSQSHTISYCLFHIPTHCQLLFITRWALFS